MLSPYDKKDSHLQRKGSHRGAIVANAQLGAVEQQQNPNSMVVGQKETPIVILKALALQRWSVQPFRKYSDKPLPAYACRNL